MSIRSIPFEEATPAQLRAFVTDFLNLELDANASDDEISTAVQRAQPGIVTIFVQEAEEPEAPAMPFAEGQPLPPETLNPEERHGRQQGSLGRDDPRWVIQIPHVETEDGAGGKDVLVGVNGRGWQLKRGVDLNLPHRVVLALDDAVANIIRHDEQGEQTSRLSKRFPYQVISQPSKAEIAEWHKRVDAQFCA